MVKKTKKSNTRYPKDPLVDKFEEIAPDLTFFVALPMLAAVICFMLIHGPIKKGEKQEDNQVYKGIKQSENTSQDSIIKIQELRIASQDSIISIQKLIIEHYKQKEN